MPYYNKKSVYRHPTGAIIQRVVRYDANTNKPLREKHIQCSVPINERTGKPLPILELCNNSYKRKFKVRKINSSLIVNVE